MPSLLTDSSFETGTADWIGYGGNSTISRVNEVAAQQGSWLSKSVAIGAGDYGWRTAVSLVPNPPQNAIYRGRGYVRGVADSVGDLLLWTVQEAGGATGAANGTSRGPTMTADWLSAGWSVKRIAQADRTDCILYFITNGLAAEACYLDNVYFDRVDTNPLEAAIIAAHPGLVSYYKLDDPADGDNTLVDVYGSNHGIYSSTVSMLQSPLVNDGYHSAAFHNALGDAAVVGTPVHRFDGNAAFSVGGWFQLNAFNGGSGHWGVNCLIGPDGWDIHMNANNVVTFFRKGVSVDYTHGSSLLGIPFFAVIRYDGTTLYGNFNGVDVTPQPSTDAITTHSANFTIGAYSEGGSGWDGPIDEIFVYDDDIGEDACMDIYTAGQLEAPPEMQTSFYRRTRMISAGRRG